MRKDGPPAPFAGEPPGPGGPDASSPFNYGPRPRRDTFWAVLFVGFWLASIVGGIYAFKHRNMDFIHTDYTDPKSCPISGRNLLAKDEPEGFDLSEFMRAAGLWLAVTSVLALLFGLVFLRAFQHASHFMTRATISFNIAVPLAMACTLLLSGLAGPAIGFFIMAGLAALVFGWWRSEIALASRLLGISAHGLAANPGIIGATILLNIASLLAVVPLLVLSAFAFMNGEVIPNPERQGAASCVDAEGQAVLCCSWQPDAFGQGYLGFAAATMLWTMLLASQIRVFVVSGTIAQWYFAPVGLASTRGNLSRSLGQALGPSFGSLCLGSAILTIASMMRQALERAQRENADANILQVCLVLLAQCFWSLVEYLTKFATVFMAITGDAFFTAGKKVTDLLTRNLLDAFASTVWFTPMVIQMASFILAAAWGALSGLGYWLLHRHAQNEANPGVNAAVLGSLTFVFTLFVLSFLGGVLLSVLDATFVCWAMDKDRRTVSNLMVYEVFQTVPIPGAAVEGPAGDISYGAPQPAYQPPVVQPSHV